MLAVTRRIARQARGIHTSAAALAEGDLKFTFSVPHKSLFEQEEVALVTVPGFTSVRGITGNAPPRVTDLQPGVVSIRRQRDGADENYIVPGGFAFTNPDNTLNLSCPEAVSAEDVDVDLLKQEYQAAQARRQEATVGSKERAEADIEVDMYRSVAYALGVSL